MLSQVVGYSFWALTGVTKQNTEESSGTAGTKADLRSISCWASSLMRTSRLSICAPRGECVCPFCSQIRPVVAQLLLPWYDACAVEHSFVILRVGSIGDCFFFTNRSHEKGLLVVKVQRAQQFGDGSPCWIFFMGDAETFFPRVRTPWGMVPRSSLKGGKNSLMVEKRTRTPNTTQTKQPKAHRPSLHHHVVFPLC